MKTVRLLTACLLVWGIAMLCLTGPLATPSEAAATIVEFRSTVCPFCYQQAEILKELQAKYGSQISVTYYNNATDQPMFDKYKVSLVPTLLIMGPSGSVMYRHEGLMPKDDLVSKLKSLNLIQD